MSYAMSSVNGAPSNMSAYCVTSNLEAQKVSLTYGIRNFIMLLLHSKTVRPSTRRCLQNLKVQLGLRGINTVAMMTEQ